MSWIEIHSGLPDHPKTIAAAHFLGIDPDMLAGKLMRLWTWAIDYRESGFFSDYETGLIAEKMRWTKPVKKLIDALSSAPNGYSAGFLEKVDGGYIIHDWEDYSGKLIARREKDRRRKSSGIHPRNDAEREDNPERNPEEFHGNSSGNPEELDGNSGCYRNHNRNHTIYGERGDTHARTRELLAFWEEISGNPVSSQMEIEIKSRVCAGYDTELLQEALRLSVGKRFAGSYFAQCLQNWRSDGVKDYAEYCARYGTSSGTNTAKPPSARTFSELAAEMEGTA